MLWIVISTNFFDDSQIDDNIRIIVLSLIGLL